MNNFEFAKSLSHRGTLFFLRNGTSYEGNFELEDKFRNYETCSVLALRLVLITGSIESFLCFNIQRQISAKLNYKIKP